MLLNEILTVRVNILCDKLHDFYTHTLRIIKTIVNDKISYKKHRYFRKTLILLFLYAHICIYNIILIYYIMYNICIFINYL